ncbi:MAG: hypothetical protein MUF36_04865 [Bacteroidales bacterium]|jgi:hypothetical protein|nr:hypothetical protein [Bacteroidales bacterium]
MEKKHFPLEPKENSRLVMIFQIIFGILCIAIALYWAIFQFASLKADSTMWITIVFLVGFGAYQVAAGFGKIKKFIEIGSERIILKQNSFLPKADLKPSDLEKIDIYPLSICFHMTKKKKMILRFGLNYTEIINPVKDAVAEFAGLNGISVEEKKEEI